MFFYIKQTKKEHYALNFTILKNFRHQVYQSFEREADALFNVCDALLCETTARSVPELSQSPWFQRRWPSIYQALKRGQINGPRLQQAWVEALLAERDPTDVLWISVDSSSIARPAAETSPGRGMIYVPNLPHATKPVSVGWQFSTVMLLPQTPSSWVGILDHQRIAPGQTAIEVAIHQVQTLIPLLKRPVVVLADRWYASADFVRACSALGCQVLIRLKRNRKLYRAPVRTSNKGRPPLHGPLWQGSRPETLGTADEQWSGTDQPNKAVTISRWHDLHCRQARELEVSVVRVVREGARDDKRDPRESWFVSLGPPLVLSEIVAVYARRFSHEHGYRFLKQDLLWTRAHVRTPAQFERWSLLVALCQNQVLLARSLGQAQYRPWERSTRPATPRQVRRIMSSILSQVGTPAQRCQRRGKSPGRALGFHPPRAPRFAVVRKKPKVAVVASG
jgi:DDE superfamily endonuclease